ncbi:MAG: MlaD family protein [Solirubrobacterales bacterium]|nr:MlaD family protein [Solirubrobacterales bacterium]
MRKTNAIAGNPMLIGAATILITVVGVFLAYSANTGLPFVPKYTLKAQIPNANALVKGNEVKIGGSRVGMVTEIAPRTWPNGRVTATITMQLDKKIEPLADDSTVEIRPVSPLGLKYVDIHRGVSAQGFKTGSVMPIKAATPTPVQIDDIFNMFNEPTRVAASANLIEFGNAIGGRGLDLNQTIRNLGPLLANLTPVMKNLSDPNTGLDRLFPALDAVASQSAPVAEQQASLFRGMAQTFGALANVTDSIQASIEGGPAALDAAISSLPVQRPFLAHSATFFNTLIPGSKALGASATTLNEAIAAGASPTGGLARSGQLNTRLATLFTSLETFLKDPNTQKGIERLTDTTDTGTPLIQYVAPAQTTCNYASVLLRNVASSTSDGFTFTSGGDSGGGTLQRALPIVPANGSNPWSAWAFNSEGGASGNAISGPEGTKTYAAGPTGDGSFGTNFLHSNSYPYTASPGQPKACQAGNESFPWVDGASTRQFSQVTAAQGLNPQAGTMHAETTPPATPPGK